MLYRKLEVPNYKEISDEVYKFIVEQTKILDSNAFWNKTNIGSFYKNNQKIISYFKSLKLTLIDAVVIQVTDKKELVVHIDGELGKEMPARIQWGILNHAGSRTALYEFKDTKMKPVQQYTTDINKSPYILIIPDSVREVDSFILDDGPVVWQPSKPHKIISGETLPRLTLTCKFIEPLDFLLEEK